MKICQSFLGAKIHDDKDPGSDLSPMFKQVVGTIFSLMEIYKDKWVEVKGSRPTAIFGFESEFAPKPINVNIDNLINKFKDGAETYMPVWEQVLTAENHQKIKEVLKMEGAHFELPIELWIKSLYDFAAAYTKQINGLSSSEIIEALVPIYYAMIASFVRQTQNMDSHQAEEVINQQCTVFEKLKPYLIDTWNSKG